MLTEQTQEGKNETKNSSIVRNKYPTLAFELTAGKRSVYLSKNVLKLSSDRILVTIGMWDMTHTSKTFIWNVDVRLQKGFSKFEPCSLLLSVLNDQSFITSF